MQWGTTRVSENASCWYSMTPPTVRNRLKVALNALSLHRWRKETPRHVTRPPAFTERKKKKNVPASSVLWLQTHFLRQSTVLNFKMSSPISWSAVSVKTSSLICAPTTPRQTVFTRTRQFGLKMCQQLLQQPGEFPVNHRVEVGVTSVSLLVLCIVSSPRIVIITTLLSHWRAMKRHQWQLIRYLVRLN